MTLKHMKIFVAVCNEKSITLAAKKIYMSQPAVSLAIKELEEHYDTKLFERLSRKLYITEPGKKVYSYAVHIVSLFDELENNVKSWNGGGRIRIGTSITIGTQLMPKFVKEFSGYHPKVEIYVTIDSSDVIENKILSNELDIALIEGVVHSGNILHEHLTDDELVVICSRENELSSLEKVTIEDLKNQHFLLREKNSGTREIVENFLSVNGFIVNPYWESTSTQAIVNAVKLNIGISILPLKLINSYQNSENLYRLNVEDFDLKRQFKVIYHKNKYLTEVEMQFIRFCKRIVNDI